VIRGINNTSYHTRHPLYTTLFTNYDCKSYILSSTNNVLLPSLHLQYAAPVCLLSSLKLQQTKHTTVDSCDGGISVLNHCLSWFKFVNTHLYHSRQWFNIHVTFKLHLRSADDLQVGPYRTGVVGRRPMLSDRCQLVLSVLSCLSVCNVGVLWPNGWMDQCGIW